MATSANTLAQTAGTLMNQLSASTITLQSYRNSMSSLLASLTDNSELTNEDNHDAVHTINLAIRLMESDK
jgi:hypothetical protein